MSSSESSPIAPRRIAISCFNFISICACARDARSCAPFLNEPAPLDFLTLSVLESTFLRRFACWLSSTAEKPRARDAGGRAGAEAEAEGGGAVAAAGAAGGGGGGAGGGGGGTAMGGGGAAATGGGGGADDDRPDGGADNFVGGADSIVGGAAKDPSPVRREAAKGDGCPAAEDPGSAPRALRRGVALTGAGAGAAAA